MIAWVFVTILLMSDGEVREAKSHRFDTWQACETARIDEVRVPLPADVQARVIRRCLSETKA